MSVLRQCHVLVMIMTSAQMPSINLLITVDLLLTDCALSKAKHMLRLAQTVDDVLSWCHEYVGVVVESTAADCPADEEPW